jgi:hypothetical protein
MLYAQRRNRLSFNTRERVVKILWTPTFFTGFRLALAHPGTLLVSELTAVLPPLCCRCCASVADFGTQRHGSPPERTRCLSLFDWDHGTPRKK